MHTDLACRKAERHAEKLSEVENLHRGLTAEHLFGTHLMHFQP